jgi:RNA polymerase sigma-70 factor (ECF subfamily)
MVAHASGVEGHGGAEGHRGAVEHLWRRRAGLLRFATSCTNGDAVEAEELVQEMLILAHRDGARIHPQARLAWARRVIRNRAINRARDAGRRRALLAQHGLDYYAAAALPPADAGVEQHEAEGRVATALAALSANHRAVLHLRYGRGLSYPEIAAELDVPQGTVMSRLHRAHAACRDALTGTPARIEDRKGDEAA